MDITKTFCAMLRLYTLQHLWWRFYGTFLWIWCFKIHAQEWKFHEINGI